MSAMDPTAIYLPDVIPYLHILLSLNFLFLKGIKKSNVGPMKTAEILKTIRKL